MKTWIALFRGINVGGNNILPMAELRKNLEALGLQNVCSYIQSGNVVFNVKSGTQKSISKKISDCVEQHHGFRPQLFLLTEQNLRQAHDANPFADVVTEPKCIHFFFLAAPAANADLDAINAKKAATETYHLTDQVFYLHAPDGIGRSKLAASAERHLGVAGTGRNLRTVEKLLSLVE
ncbi:MAG: DUF1697 domain-containing protein [Planctomycetes bacterium]|nr:DUF1697 domain-containing protein [Planctomycetota bacterium]